MRNNLIAATLVAIAAAAAAQADTAVGRIGAIDVGNSTVTLRDGMTFDFAQSRDAGALTAFLPGDAVSVVYSENQGRRVGEGIASTSVFQSVGRISAIDAAAGTVTLEGGRSFSFAKGSAGEKDLYGFKVGDPVRVAYDRIEGRRVGSDIGGTRSDQVSGVVKALDLGGGTVTLENGKTYRFDTNRRGAEGLASFRPGDRVDIILQPDGRGEVAEFIAPAVG